MKSIKLFSPWICLMCVVIFSGCSREKEKYFTSLDTNAWFLYHGSNPVNAGKAGERNCYRFLYDAEGRVKEITYLKAGLAAINPETDFHRAVYTYTEGFIDVAFYDHLGNLTKSEDGAAKLRYRLDADGHLKALYYYGVQGRMTRNKTGVFQYAFTTDKKGNVVAAVSKDPDGNRMPGESGVWETRSTYSREGYLTKVQFIGPDGEPMTNRTSGVAEIRYTYDSKGIRTEERYFDLNGKKAVE
ncbi:MAG TPA: hypothetical protein P5338_12510, partial [Bacteroidales bacterium]|nr:hypothetical protein [Bacteroidales bacterium]